MLSFFELCVSTIRIDLKMIDKHAFYKKLVYKNMQVEIWPKIQFFGREKMISDKLMKPTK